MRNFLWIWVGQVVSVLGSGLTRFALGVWVFQETGSATLFTWIAFAATIPALALSPIAGVLADRWDRRRVMLGADAGAAVATLVLAALAFSDALSLPLLYLLVAVGSAFDSLQFPAFTASTSLLVPKQHLGRASGLVQLGHGTSRVLAPLLAGALLGTLGLGGILLADFATFLVAAATLLVIRIPSPPRTEERGPRPSLWRQSLYGWSYIRERPGLLRLLLFFASLNLLVPIVTVLATPLVLAFADERALGIVLGAGSGGAIVGSLVMSAWGGPKRRVFGVLGIAPVVVIGMVVAGLKPSLPWITVGLFLIFFTVPILNGCSQAIWQTKVAPEVQGRVFAMRRLIAQLTGPIAFLAAGPLADLVFEPLLAQGGPLAATLGPHLGIGPGRGIGLLFLCLGLLFLGVVALGWSDRRLRGVEGDLPDALGDG